MPDVVVIGGGVGGLAVALRRAAAGDRVTVVERSGLLGGKLDERVREGFTFETGPSLLTLPFIFDDLFAAAGTSFADEVSLVRLDPVCTYDWPDGSRLVLPGDRSAAIDAIEDFSPGSGSAWARFLDYGERIWDVSYRTFFAGPIESPARLVRRMRSPRDLLAIDPLRTLDRTARRFFRDPRLVQLVNRYATYSGSSPFRAPATLACIPAIESRYGAWYVEGGLPRIRDALVRQLNRLGVAVELNRCVTAIDDDGTGVTGVRLDDERFVGADVVIANTDAHHLYADLLDDAPMAARTGAVERSSSGFVVLAAVEGRTPGLGHHNIVFSSDYRREFEALFDAQMPAREPTVYACVSAVTDPTQAPAGAENWFLLANAPSHPVAWDRERYAETMLDRYEQRYPGLRGRIRWQETITPTDIAERYNTPGGAIYGTSSNGIRAAFRRPANRGPRRGLYLVGGSSHPGGGLPLVTQSAAIVSAMIDADGALES